MMQLPDYSVSGSGETTVFLLHGGSGDRSYFADDIAVLVEAGYRVVAWDAPGFGNSPEPEVYGIDVLADLGAALLDAEGTERNIIVAQSFGGIVAPAMVHRTSRTVSALITSSAPALRPAVSAAAPQPKAPTPVASEGDAADRQATRAAQFRAVMAPEAAGPLVERVIEVASRVPSDAVLGKVVQAIRAYDGIPAVSTLAIPTLWMAGRHDPIATPEKVEETAAMVPGGEFQLIEGAGHFIFAEQPEAYREAMFAFLKRHDLGATEKTGA